ncbi:11500_t:CDS:2, partial [Acaulospora morrowiae]
SSTKVIPRPIDSRSEDTNMHEETIIPDPSPEIEHSAIKSEIRCSASPSTTSLPQDDTSKQMSENASDISGIAPNSGTSSAIQDLSYGSTETILSKNDQDGNLCDMKTVPSGNDRD